MIIKLIRMLDNNRLIKIRIFEWIANAVPTAEGAILYAMQNSEITLHDSRCVILGFGRCAKVLADKLKGIGAKVVIGARKIEDLTYAKAYGYECFSLKHLNTHLANCDFIFNTIPFILLDATTIECMDKKSVYIELASMPGGIDKEACKAKEIRYVEAPSLPGKVAPTTAAEIIYEALLLLFQKED
jgi:dipicolinate synthase subunit A